MSRHKLEFELPETDFLLFGICSQAKDYRLVWIINKTLSLALKREKDIPQEEITFAVFSYDNRSSFLKYYLIGNKKEGKIFVRQLKQIDYLFIIKGNYSAIDQNEIVMRLKESETVLAAYSLNPELIKEKQYLIEE